MSTVLPTDLVLINRNGTDYQTFADMSTVQDDDFILVNRNNVDYKCTFEDLKKSKVDPLSELTPTTIVGIAEVGATLRAVEGTVQGGREPITYATRWQTSADGTGNWSDLPGATGIYYAIKDSDLNQYLRAVTTATDSKPGTVQTLELSCVPTQKVICPPPATFSWDANADVYGRYPVADRRLDVHARIRRVCVKDNGTLTYLDADKSTVKAGDWLRLVETTELSAPYTGTHGEEVTNTALRASAQPWEPYAFSKGMRVTHNGKVWECLAATTTSLPAAGTETTLLNGGEGQVMTEIPLFSVKHATVPTTEGELKHTFQVSRCIKTTDNWAVHPAFVKPDGSYREFIYVSAYQATGAHGSFSTTGANNTTLSTRAQCRSQCRTRGAGWHTMGYWEYNALQWLLITEYQDMNSQRVVGNGSVYGDQTYVPNGTSDTRGNRCGHASAGRQSDYVSYRGLENLWGRAYQWVDGINVIDGVVYLCADPAKWADDTDSGYTVNGTLPSTDGWFQRDVMDGIALLPSKTNGASSTTFVGDIFYIGQNHRTVRVGGLANGNGNNGFFLVAANVASTYKNDNTASRLAYAAT